MRAAAAAHESGESGEPGEPGEPEAAEHSLRRLLAAEPNNVTATQDLALRLLQRGALAEAEQHARNAVRLAPADAQSHNLLGMVLTEAHQPQAGEFHYRRVLALSGARDPILLANLAWCLARQGRLAEARALYEESVAAAPAVLQTLLGWARLEEADRAFEAAAALVERAELVAPGHPSLALLRAVLHGRTGRPEAALSVLERLASRTADTGGLTAEELLEKGRLLDRIGRHADAFTAFDTAKSRLRAATGDGYRAEAAAGFVARLRGFFTARRLASLPRAGIRRDVAQPVFILGFPRSGTTLVEQTLAAHTGIGAGDELPFISELAALAPRLLCSPLGYPEALAELWMGDRHEGLDVLRDLYLQRARQHGLLSTGADLFTDKMPLNETHLGLIALLFPAAPMIHLRRHPLDVMLSVHANALTHGFCCGYALESAARHYALIVELMAHYEAELTARLLPVRYEDLVRDHERQVRRMLAFVGVPFEPACLRFDKHRRYARTASYAQVTEPLYDRSCGRWRHYRSQLAPVIPILMPAMRHLGYTLG